MQYFGEKLKDLRLKNNMTQQQLADRLGLVKSSISAYEQSAKYPSLDILKKICSVFDVSADYLLGISDDMQLLKSNLTDEQIKIIRRLIMEFELCNK